MTLKKFLKDNSLSLTEWAQATPQPQPLTFFQQFMARKVLLKYQGKTFPIVRIRVQDRTPIPKEQQILWYSSSGKAIYTTGFGPYHYTLYEISVERRRKPFYVILEECKKSIMFAGPFKDIILCPTRRSAETGIMAKVRYRMEADKENLEIQEWPDNPWEDVPDHLPGALNGFILILEGFKTKGFTTDNWYIRGTFERTLLPTVGEKPLFLVYCDSEQLYVATYNDPEIKKQLDLNGRKEKSI